MSTIKSQTPSLDNADQKRILEGFLEGEISLTNLQSLLKGYITLDFTRAPGQRNIQNVEIDPNIQIPVMKEYLCNMLRKYMCGELSELDLSNWAAFIYMSTFYIPEGETEEERWKEGEGPIWEILQKLVAPSIYDGLNSKIAKKYLDLLSSNL